MCVCEFHEDYVINGECHSKIKRFTFCIIKSIFGSAVTSLTSLSLTSLRFPQEFKYLDPNQGIQWVLGHPPEAHPPCGFDGERCSVDPDPVSIVLLTLAVCVALVAAIFAFRSVVGDDDDDGSNNGDE